MGLAGAPHAALASASACTTLHMPDERLVPRPAPAYACPCLHARHVPRPPTLPPPHHVPPHTHAPTPSSRPLAHTHTRPPFTSLTPTPTPTPPSHLSCSLRLALLPPVPSHRGRPLQRGGTAPGRRGRGPGHPQHRAHVRSGWGAGGGGGGKGGCCGLTAKWDQSSFMICFVDVFRGHPLPRPPTP